MGKKIKDTIVCFMRTKGKHIRDVAVPFIRKQGKKIMYVMFWYMVWGLLILPGYWRVTALFLPLLSDFIYSKVVGEPYTFTETQAKMLFPVFFSILLVYVIYLEYFA